MISVFCVYICVLLLFVFCFIYVPMCCLCSLCIDKLFVRSVFFFILNELCDVCYSFYFILVFMFCCVGLLGVLLISRLTKNVFVCYVSLCFWVLRWFG